MSNLYLLQCMSPDVAPSYRLDFVNFSGRKRIEADKEQGIARSDTGGKRRLGTAANSA
jgi:hypothetical protein